MEAGDQTELMSAELIEPAALCQRLLEGLQHDAVTKTPTAARDCFGVSKQKKNILLLAIELKYSAFNPSVGNSNTGSLLVPKRKNEAQPPESHNTHSCSADEPVLVTCSTVNDQDICRPCLSIGLRWGELMRLRWTLSTSPWCRVPLTESNPEGKPP